MGQLSTRICDLSGPGDLHHGPVLDTDVFVGLCTMSTWLRGPTDPTVCAVFEFGWLVG